MAFDGLEITECNVSVGSDGQLSYSATVESNLDEQVEATVVWRIEGVRAARDGPLIIPPSAQSFHEQPREDANTQRGAVFIRGRQDVLTGIGTGELQVEVEIFPPVTDE